MISLLPCPQVLQAVLRAVSPGSLEVNGARQTASWPSIVIHRVKNSALLNCSVEQCKWSWVYFKMVGFVSKWLTPKSRSLPFSFPFKLTNQGTLDKTHPLVCHDSSSLQTSHHCSFVGLKTDKRMLCPLWFLMVGHMRSDPLPEGKPQSLARPQSVGLPKLPGKGALSVNVGVP